MLRPFVSLIPEVSKPERKVRKAGSRTKNGPSVKTSRRGTGSHVVSGLGLAVICTRGWGPVSSARVLARSAISDECAYVQRPGNKAK